MMMVLWVFSKWQYDPYLCSHPPHAACLRCRLLFSYASTTAFVSTLSFTFRRLDHLNLKINVHEGTTLCPFPHLTIICMPRCFVWYLHMKLERPGPSVAA